MVSGLASSSLALLAGAALICVSASSRGQEDDLRIELPNPDGRDPVFDRSNLRKQIAIEFSTLADGKTLSLTDSAGRLRLINFWATWCAPCVRELPSLAALAMRYSDDKLAVIAISLDREGPDAVADFLATLQVHGLDWFIDSSRRSGLAADVFVLPTSVIVDAQGRELGRIVGSADWNSTQAEALIDALLAETE